MLTIENLVLRRGRRLLSRRVDFVVEEGSCALIVGPNGSGKSTLLRLLAGFGRVEEGVIRWRGRAIDDWADAYRAQIAFLGHQEGVKQMFTPQENLAYRRLLLGPQGWRIPPDQPLFDVAKLPAQPCHRLSAGQRRRVALACLEHNQAPLWLLDEPLTALDEEGIDAVGELVSRHLSTGGTAVLASHQPLPRRLQPSIVVQLGGRR